MKVKDVIAECLIRAGKEDFTRNSTLTDEQQKTRNRLLGCFNIAYREIVSKYLPLVHSEKVEFSNGVLSAKSLEKKILYPIRVQVGDQRKAFCAGVDKIECDVQGSAILTYAYMPDADFSIDDEFDDMRLTRSALVNGTLGEYYFQNKVFDLAKNFDTEFRTEMGMLRYKGKNVVIKRRGWRA